MAGLARSVWRTVILVSLLLAACLDGHYSKRFCGMRVGPDGAIWVSGWCRRIVRALGIRLTVEGPLPEAGGAGLAVVSNHLSYLDVLVYSALRPFVMVSKTEVRGWPLLGWITAQAGTVYVERADVKGGQKQSRDEVNQLMAEAFRSGLPVLFFPEGTTTDGSEILPFRRGLFNSVVDNGVALKVAALAFSFDEPNPGKTVGEHVSFTGDAVFGPHLFECLGLRGLHVSVRFGEGAVTGTDRFGLAEAARDRVVALHDALVQQLAGAQQVEHLGDRPVERLVAVDGDVCGRS